MSSKGIEKLIPLRKKVVLPLKVKLAMLDRLRLGESFASISRSFNVNESTVRFIKKSEEKIRNSIGSTTLSAKIVRDPAIEKMEAALSLWIEDCNQRRVPLSGPLIRDEAKRLYAHFKTPSEDCTDREFQASEGWFHKFKMRHALQANKVLAVEATATENFDIAKCIVSIKETLDELRPETLRSYWNKLWPALNDESVQKLFQSQDEDVKVTAFDGMLPPQPIRGEEASMIPQKVGFNLKSLGEGLQRANELCDFFMEIDPFVERSLTCKRQIMDAIAEYRSEFENLAKEAKQPKITKFFKPLPKPGSNY